MCVGLTHLYGHICVRSMCYGHTDKILRSTMEYICVYTSIRVYIYICVYIYIVCPHMLDLHGSIYICVYIYICVIHICVYIYRCVYIYICIHIFMYIYIYIYLYTYIYIYMSTHVQINLHRSTYIQYMCQIYVLRPCFLDPGGYMCPHIYHMSTYVRSTQIHIDWIYIQKQIEYIFKNVPHRLNIYSKMFLTHDPHRLNIYSKMFPTHTEAWPWADMCVSNKDCGQIGYVCFYRGMALGCHKIPEPQWISHVCVHTDIGVGCMCQTHIHPIYVDLCI